MSRWRLTTRWIWAMALGAFFGRLLSVYPGGLFFQWPFVLVARALGRALEGPAAIPLQLAALSLALGLAVSVWQVLALGPRVRHPWAWALGLPWVWAWGTALLAAGLLSRAPEPRAWLTSPWGLGAALLWGLAVGASQAWLLPLPARAWPRWLLLNALGGAWFWLYGLVRLALQPGLDLPALLAPILWAVLTGPFLEAQAPPVPQAPSPPAAEG